jgi:hypothetical protein
MSDPLGLPEEVRLYGWAAFDEAAAPIRALLFGQLAERATLITKHYLSDLYVDALWLGENVNGACEFLWMAREWGTDIGNHACIQAQIIGPSQPRALYRVKVQDRDGDWWAVFEHLVVAEFLEDLELERERNAAEEVLG